MATISEMLLELNDIKQDLKTNIIAKGQIVSEADAWNQGYGEKWAELEAAAEEEPQHEE